MPKNAEVVNGADGEPLKVPQREKGYLYFVDKEGHVMRSKMARGEPLSDAEVKKRAAEKEKKAAKRAEDKKKKAQKDLEALNKAAEKAKLAEQKRQEKKAALEAKAQGK